MSIDTIYKRILSSKLFKDSFWAVFGNGLGNALLLLAGIFIARMLGKDLYGEYGLVKTTMFHVAAFATFGLGFTSTKFIAEHIQKNTLNLRLIIKSSLIITIVFSSLMCFFLFLFANQLASFVNEPRLAISFRFLGLVVVFRAINTTTFGLLGGFKAYKRIGINNILSSVFMLLGCVPLTYYIGVKGSLLALLLSQLLLCFLNLFYVKRLYSELPISRSDEKFVKKLLCFSLPVAIQELSYTLCAWGCSLILTRYSSLGELGIYSATAQWKAIIMFIPSLLSNVVLSYLSGISGDKEKHLNMLNKMLLINFVCILIPFLVVFSFSGLICSFYGASFVGMRTVLNITILSTVFICLAHVFQSSLISEGRNWVLLLARSVRDIMTLILLYIVLIKTRGVHSAYHYAIIDVTVAFFYFFLLAFFYYGKKKNLGQNSN